jgi:hypothetical protein
MTTFSSSWFVVDQAVQVALGESTYPEFTGQMIELSTTGIRLRTDRPLIPGSAVELRWNGTALSAEVQKCIEAKPDFLIEVRLRPVVAAKQRGQKAAASRV